jgi:hypothetical protein
MPFLPNHVEELVEMQEMEFWINKFGVSTRK